MSSFILLGLDGACPDIFEDAVIQGLMPNMKRMREIGCCADNVPFPAAVTPGNWVSIATGSKPSVHGISDFSLHTPGQPLDERHEAFTKGNSRAQFLWDAFSERVHKAATIAYPGAMPQTAPLHLAIGGTGKPAENTTPYTMAPSRALVAGKLNPVGPYDWREHERVELEKANDDTQVDGFVPACKLKLAVQATNPGYSGAHQFDVYLGRHDGAECAVLIDGDRKQVIRQGEWSTLMEKGFQCDEQHVRRWQAVPFKEADVPGEFRFRLTHIDLDAGDLLLFISNVYPKYHFSSDPAVTRVLREKLGPYDDNLPISRMLMDWLDVDGLVENFRAQAIWQARAALELVNELGYKAVLVKWHGFDKFYHFYMQKIDSMAPCYSTEDAEFYEDLHRRLLSIADEMVGIVLNGLRGDTSLVVISDHGLMASRRAAWVNRLLAKHGYIVFKEAGNGPAIVDWSRTRTFVSAFLLLNINLKGRDPDGIVEPGQEYEALKRELVELLRSWQDPQTGQHVMADVFDPKADGAFYGLGSDMDGDIRYFTTPGYTLYRSVRPDGGDLITDTVGPCLGDHGSCRPTTRYGRGSEVGLFYAAGCGFKAVGKRKEPIFPCDVVPTILHIMGEPPLAHQQGAVLGDLLTDRASGRIQA